MLDGSPNMLRKLSTWILQSSRVEKFLLFRKNVFGDQHEKRALLSYIVEPFVKGATNIHQNRQQVLLLAYELDRLGFSVDVVDFRANFMPDISDYDLIIGFGRPFERSFQFRSRAKRIYYATGPHFSQRNMAEAIRGARIYRRTGYCTPPRRLKEYPEYLSVTCADAIMCTGDDWVHSTFRPFTDRPIYPVSITAPGAFVGHRAITANAPRHLLWIGGEGCLLKGLDLCLEALADSRLKDVELHICGPIAPEFRELMRDFMERPGNHFHGHVDVYGDDFRGIVERCMFVICPASSEAGCGAVLAAMKSGLVPITTTEATIADDSGRLPIEGATVEAVRSALLKAQAVSDTELGVRSLRAIEYVAERHTREDYIKSVSRALQMATAAGIGATS